MVVLTNTMFNFFRKKPIARWYSLERGLEDVWPVIPAASVKRNWRTKSQNPNPEHGSNYTKNCPGMNLLMSAGWVITVPADFKITTNGDGIHFDFLESVRFQNEKAFDATYIGFHDQEQSERILDDPKKNLKTVVKVHTPWRVEIDPDYFLIQMPVHYNNEDRFTPATGILDPSYSHEINVQLFWHVMEGETLIKAGTPLVQYIPIHKNAYMSNQFDFSCVPATEDDRKLERAFDYALRSVFQQTDILKSRLDRVRKVMHKYRSKRSKK